MPENKTAPFFLFGIDPDRHDLANPEIGTWRYDNDFLSKYAGDISIDKLKDPNVSHSVPTIFTRAIQFFNALKDSKHPLHDPIINEWRGIMAVFGLRSWFNYSLEITRFSVSPGSGSQADEDLKRILRSQLPHPNAEWENWWLIKCNDGLIGSTSPWSVIYTPSEYNCPGIIPWQTKGKLYDPIEYYKRIDLSYELMQLNCWITNLLEVYEINGHHWGLDNRFSGIVRYELEKWQSEIAENIGPKKLFQILPGIQPVKKEPYKHFLSEMKFQIDGKGPGPKRECDLLIHSTRSRAPKTILFSRREIPSGARVYGAVFGDQIDISALTRSQGEANWTTPNGVNIPFPYLIAEEVFLPPKLYRIEQSEHALVLGEGDSLKYATPLTAKFFKYFSLKDLIEKEMLTVREEEGKVRVRLQIPLTSGDSQMIEKVYSNDEIISAEQVGGIPVLGYWPDFYVDDWQENIALLHAPETQKHLAVSPLLSTGERVTPGSSLDQAEQETRLWYCKKPVIGFELNYLNHGVNSISAGLILRKSILPPRKSTPGRSWTVAVDFGTSNTNVWVKNEKHEKIPLSCQNRTRVLTNADANRIDIALSKLYAQTTIIPHFPTLSVEKMATVLVNVDEAQNHDARFDFEFARVLSEADRFDANLKWGAGGANIGDKPLRSYLKGLVRYIVSEARAEGVGNLNIRWSYPLSLPKAPRSAISNYWNTIDQSFTSSEKLTVHVDSTGIPESVAVAKRMRQVDCMMPDTGGISIGVDIGGGSTDIAFWTSGENVNNLSLKLAGNDLMAPISRLTGWPSSFVGALYGDVSEEFISMANAAFPTVRGPLLINALLTSKKSSDGTKPAPLKHPLALALYSSLHKGDPPWKYACSSVYIFFCGLAFYLGLHARKYVKAMTNKEITVYIGGLGSNLLTWISRDWNDLEEILADAFKAGLCRNVKENENINVMISSHINVNFQSLRPKDEVAAGLLDDEFDIIGSGKQYDIDPEKIQSIIGEMGWLNKADDTELMWDDLLTINRIKEIKPPDNFDSCYISTFLNSVLKKHNDKHSLDQENLEKLKLTHPSKVENRLIVAKAGGHDVIQPIFINELKLLLEEYFKMIGIAVD